MKGLAEHFDFSNYPTTHPLYSIENKAVLGKFKDETAGEPIEEFIGLRSKMLLHQAQKIPPNLQLLE